MAMKFRAHDTFFIRKGWLNKGMKYVKKNPDIFVSRIEKPTDVLGIGANMVKSLRYWLQAIGITKEVEQKRKRVQEFTELGKLIYENDRYIEEIGTLELLQYRLATNKENATAWYFFFNIFNMSEFTRDDFVNALQRYVAIEGQEEPVAIRSLNDDFSCIINTYNSTREGIKKALDPEDNMNCPFRELGLIEATDNKKYRRISVNASKINPWIALAIIQDRANGKKEISLNELLTVPGYVGRVFNLDAITLVDVLYQIEKLNELKIIRTAGLDVVQILHSYSFEECVQRYYDSISNN